MTAAVVPLSVQWWMQNWARRVILLPFPKTPRIV
jgi:hypothetical protein